MAPLSFRSAALAALPVIATSLVGNFVTLPRIEGWYAGLTKPFFNPPNWVFGPVWTALFVMMAYSAYRIWQLDPAIAGRRRALRAFYLQLALNAGWSVAFFGLQSPAAGIGVIVLLLVMIMLTIRDFSRLDRVAALLLVPYAAWVSYASLINAAIWWLNR